MIVIIFKEMTETNYNKTLPPSKNQSCKYGKLIISIEGLTFFSQNKQSFLIKLQFWGQPHPTYIPLHSSQTFTIVASLNNFKTYLIDCKATKFEIVDSRNYKPVGCAFLNWMAYLRSLDDKQIYIEKQDNLMERSNGKKYYLPFFDEILQESLPVYHFTAQNQVKKQEKIGELRIKWSCRVGQGERSQKTSPNLSNINSGSNPYNVRVSQTTNQKYDIAPVSICDIQLQQDPSQEINIKSNKTIGSKRQSNNTKLSVTDYPYPRRSNLSNFQNKARYFKKIAEEPEAQQQRMKMVGNKSKNELDLQLIRVRFEMQELVGATSKKDSLISLQIIHFQSISKLLPTKEVTHCDIKSQGKEINSHLRIYPSSQMQDKVVFNSAIQVKAGSLLTFSIGTKKGKDVPRGSMPIDCIRDCYDLNIISSQPSVVGYLRVKVEVKGQAVIVPQTLKQNSSRNQNLKSQIPPNPPESIKKPKQSFALQQNYRSGQKRSPEEYFLISFQPSKRSKNSDIRFNVFEMAISELNPQKLAFALQSEWINKPLIVTAFQNDCQVHRQVIVQSLKPTPFASVNLTCSLIFQKVIAKLDVNCQLYVGNLQQINYFLQKYMQSKSKQERIIIPQSHPRTESQQPIKTQESNKNSVIAQLQFHGLGQQKRKLKTQALGGEDRDRRMTEEKVSGQSVAMEKFQMNSQNQANDEQNIYLVDLLTRFLDFLPQNLLPDIPQMPKETFLQLLSPALKSSIFQVELVDIIISIFQQLNNQHVNVQQLSQCFKAYRSFLNIYTQQKQAVIKQVLQAQPKAVQRIRNNTEFGTLNQSMLWGRALSKVKDSSVKQKLNKLYKISSFGTSDAAFLLEDLQSKGKQLRSLDISNLGMLIKQWVQEFISRADLQKVLNLKQKLLACGEEDSYLNIRSVADVIELSLELRLSLWESLMLIQQIKGSYGCDLQLEEGVIGGPSLLNWIESVRKRSKLKSQVSQRLSQSSASLDPEELALIKRINEPSNNNSQVQRRESGHKSESRSMVVGNNDSDIADIANLLREKDGYMPFDLIEQIRGNNGVDNKSVGKKLIQESQKILNSDIQETQNKPIVKVDTPKSSIQKGQKENGIKEKQKQGQKEMEFYVQIKQFKLYNQNNQSNLIKALFRLQKTEPGSTKQDFFYLTSKKQFSQANQSILKYTIDKKSAKSQCKGIKISLNEEANPLYSGFLPIQEITDWFSKNQAECKRTIVLYQPRGKIGGKLVINLLLNSKKQLERQEDKSAVVNEDSKICITLNDIIPHLKVTKLFAKYNQTEVQQIKLNENLDIQLKRPIYHCQIIICDEQETINSIISLEELYLRHFINESYPLVDTSTGSFVATISLTLAHNQKGIKFTQIVPKVNIQQSLPADYSMPNKEFEEKRSLISQIDGIYESLKTRFG